MHQIKHADINNSNDEGKTNSTDLNFIKRSNLRLTNALIKTIIETHKDPSKSENSNQNKDASSLTNSLINSSKNKISKKNKTKLKKQFWHDRKLFYIVGYFENILDLFFFNQKE